VTALAADAAFGSGIARRSVRKLNRLHGPLALFLVIVVAFSAVPLGSNRPFFWSLWSTILGFAAVAYVGAVSLMRSELYVPLKSIGALCAIFATLCLTLMVQLLPLGGLYWGAGIVTEAGVRLQPPFVTTTPGETALMLLRWLGYGIMFFLTLQMASNSARRMWIIQALAAVIVGHAILAILSFYQWGNTILGLEKWAYLDSVTGTFVNRNSFATFMAVGLTITTALAINALETRRGVHLMTAIATCALYALFLLGALLGSNSRMGLVVGLLGVVAVVACHVRGGQGGRWRLLLGSALAIAVAVAAAFTYQSGVWMRFFELERSGEIRMELYRQTWRMIAEAPFLGFGGGSFAQAFQLFHQPPLDVEILWDRAHNTYFALWSELGLLVGSMPLLLVAIISFSSLKALRRSGPVDPSVTIWIGGTAVAAVHSLVDFSFEMYALALLFAMLGGLAMSANLSRAKGLVGAPAGH